MFGLCMPTGETYLILENGIKESIEMTDEANPRKYIMEDEYVLKQVKRVGYKNIISIMYERNGKETIVNMADYYAEHGQELEG